MNVERIGEKIRRELQGKVFLLEYITLPEAGQHVVLRFEPRAEISGLDEIDAIENRLSQLVVKGFGLCL